MPRAAGLACQQSAGPKAALLRHLRPWRSGAAVHAAAVPLHPAGQHSWSAGAPLQGQRTLACWFAGRSWGEGLQVSSEKQQAWTERQLMPLSGSFTASHCWWRAA